MTDPTPVAHALARDCQAWVDLSLTSTPDWQRIRFISAFAPVIDPTWQAANTYEDGGWGRSVKTMQSWTVSFNIDLYLDEDDAYLPEAQAFKDAAIAFDAGSLLTIQWEEPNGDLRKGQAGVTWARAENDTDALDRATVTLTGQGALNLAPTPIA